MKSLLHLALMPLAAWVLISHNSPAQGLDLFEGQAAPMEMAVTVDDLPAHGSLSLGSRRVEIGRQLISALKSNGVPEAYGFVNGVGLEWERDNVTVLRDWLRAGYPLANHTYSHLDPDKVSASDYIADIEKDDAVLASFADGSPLVSQRRVFRYPYLKEGSTREKHDAIHDYLTRHGYTVAPVSIYYVDWAWDEAYVRCVNARDQPATQWLRIHVVDAALREQRHAQQLAKLLFGRDIKHILLIHIGVLYGLSTGEILTEFRYRGVRFIPLREALHDPAYQFNTDLLSAWDKDFLGEVADAKHVTNPAEDPLYPLSKLEQMCRPRLPRPPATR